VKKRSNVNEVSYNQYTGFRNKGCEATTKAIVNEITKLQNDAEFKIFTGDVDYDVLWMPENRN